MEPHELKIFLEAEAKDECWCDDKEFIPNDYAGGNIDDAYDGGLSDGRVLFARQLLKSLTGESWA